MTDNASIVRDPIEDLRQLVQEATGNVPSWTLTRGIRALDALSAELSDLKADLERAREEEREQWKKAVEDEPEFPGDIPDDLYETVRQLVSDDDRDAIAETMRIIVRLTKEGIIARAALNGDTLT